MEQGRGDMRGREMREEGRRESDRSADSLKGELFDMCWLLSSPKTAQQQPTSPKTAQLAAFQPSRTCCLICIVLYLFIFLKNKTYPRIGFFRKLLYPHIRILPIPIRVSISVLHSC